MFGKIPLTPRYRLDNGLLIDVPGLQKELSRYAPTGIEDTIAELETWAAFSEERPARPRIEPPSPVSHPAAPIGESPSSALTLPQRKTGRNEPCPCGSGKKYKKCCG